MGDDSRSENNPEDWELLTRSEAEKMIPSYFQNSQPPMCNSSEIDAEADFETGGRFQVITHYPGPFRVSAKEEAAGTFLAVSNESTVVIAWEHKKIIQAGLPYYTIRFRDVEYDIPEAEFLQMQEEDRASAPDPSNNVPNAMAFLNVFARLYRRMKEENRLPPARKTAHFVRTAMPSPKRLPTFLRFGDDNVNRAAITSLARAQDWKANPADGITFGLAQNYQGMDLRVTVGLPDKEEATSLWGFLCKSGPRMVKAHYALWARWYEDGNGSDFVTININQFCSDLGYAKATKGGFKPERKREAVKVLEILTALELRAVFNPPGKKQAFRLRGPIWTRGVLAEENDQYADLFGQAREGDSSVWEPVGFSFAPGPFFTDANWRRYNQRVGKIGAGLMKLSNDKDEWAILVGGYIGTLARTEQYQARKIRVDTILRKTGLAQGEDAQRRVSQYRAKLDRALERLVEVGVLAQWTWSGMDASEPDMNDPDAIAAYGAADPLPKGDWRRQCIEITWPKELEECGKRIRNAQVKRIEASKKRKEKQTG